MIGKLIGMKHARDLKKRLKNQAQQSGKELDLDTQIEAVKKEKEELQKIKAYNKEVEDLGKLHREVKHPMLHKLGENVKRVLKDTKDKRKANIDTPENPFLKKPKNPFR